MFSTTSSWCWGSVPCYRSQPGRQLQLLRPRSSPWMTHSTFSVLPESTHRRPRCWGTGNSALPSTCSNDLCEFQWLFSFGAPLPLVTSCGSELLESTPATGGGSLLSLNSRQGCGGPKALLIVKDQHTQPSAAEHVEGNAGHNHQVSAQHRRHRKSQLWQRGLCHWCCRF